MKKQMVAERERRGEFIRAEGNKAAMRLKSEGTKRVKFTMGVAEQEATRKRCGRPVTPSPFPRYAALRDADRRLPAP